MFDLKKPSNNSRPYESFSSHIEMAAHMTKKLDTYDIQSPLHQKEMLSNTTLTPHEEKLMNDVCKHTPTPAELKMTLMHRNFWHGFAWQLVSHTYAIEQGIAKYKLMIKDNPGMSAQDAYPYLEEFICKMVELEGTPEHTPPKLTLVK